jgi:hypothetical protein
MYSCMAAMLFYYTKHYLNKNVAVFKDLQCYHTVFQDPTLSDHYVTPTSEVCMASILFLLVVLILYVSILCVICVCICQDFHSTLLF